MNNYDYLGYSWFSKLWKKIRHVVVSNVIRIVGNIIAPGLGEVLSGLYEVGVGAKYGGVKGALMAFASPRLQYGSIRMSPDYAMKGLIVNPAIIGVGRSRSGGGAASVIARQGGFGSRSPFGMNFTGIDGNPVETPGRVTEDFFERLAHLGVGIIAGMHESIGGTVLPPVSEVNRRGKMIGHAIGVVGGAVGTIGGGLAAVVGVAAEPVSVGTSTVVVAGGVAIAAAGVAVGTRSIGLLKADMEGPSLGGGNPEKPNANAAKEARRATDQELKKAWGNVHEAKDLIRQQYGKELNKIDSWRNFDVYLDKNGKVILQSLKDPTKRVETGLPLEVFKP